MWLRKPSSDRGKDPDGNLQWCPSLTRSRSRSEKICIEGILQFGRFCQARLRHRTGTKLIPGGMILGTIGSLPRITAV
ncbi:hypothetical protein FA10DRAFT_263822 [Acaromyces ingoldii]|uniref:Uncharacterized protein n=1 Tax=Acaromyces ingoldii TaxID=215250 RepID=A0A316YU69_9BASI|nr:hypothetical protein FA10DRAFT_263822 [Acaromyces ingoldii]PWN93120.1 hypothetical protein FA10DRAFT_263822 [Acaromyces ingoldii]